MNDLPGASIFRDRRSLLVIAGYVAACLIAFPYFRQIIDPDDTAYLQIAERWAKGDYAHAVNGMWSPLNCWIGALLAPTGVAFIFLFKFLNIGFGVIAMLATGQLMIKAGLHERRWLILGGLLPFAVFATYHELCADWLQCTILLLYLNLIYSSRYKSRPYYAVLCGVLGALAYYAKYYNFHFFWLHFALANFFLYYDFDRKQLPRIFWRRLATGIGTLVLLALPWVLLLHQKYGFWGLNYTGKIDLSWSIDSNTLWDGKYLMPPTQPGGANFWEDPIWLQHHYVTPFTSVSTAAKQAVITILAFSSFMTVLNEFSPFLLTIWAVSLFLFLIRGYRVRNFETSAVLTFLTMPAGYFLFHFEGRFIWPLCILGYILGWILLERYAFPRLRRWACMLVALLFTATFSLKPAEMLYKCIQRDDDAYKLAGQLRDMHLQGSFITNLATDQQKLMRTGYLARMPFYIYSYWRVEQEPLLDAVIRYQVNYYFEFKDGRILIDPATVSQLVEVTGGRIPGLKIYRLH